MLLIHLFINIQKRSFEQFEIVALLTEKDSLSLIVCVESWVENSMSAKGGHTTIVQEERSVELEQAPDNTRFCFDYGVPIEQSINITGQLALCVALASSSNVLRELVLRNLL